MGKWDINPDFNRFSDSIPIRFKSRKLLTQYQIRVMWIKVKGKGKGSGFI